MRTLVSALSRNLNRLVLDETGLKGEYDVALTWTDSGDTGPSLFTALQEQLGLKLESRKGTVEMLVIDGAERPSAN